MSKAAGRTPISDLHRESTALPGFRFSGISNSPLSCFPASGCMISEALIRKTLEQFPRLEKGALRIEPLEKGGSDRKFYRLRAAEGEPLILVEYGHQRDENRHYVDIARFLGSVGVHVPEIYFHEETADGGLIWMEDLGELDLWTCRAEPWERLRELYRSALEQAVRLHTRAHAARPASRLVLQKAFDTELYLWEQHYFFENCLGLYFKADPAAVEAHRHGEALRRIAAHLAALPRVLVHRDFQSQNIMIKQGRACLIDFQGLRPGLGPYDLASLLYDPYVPLTPPQRAELREDYLAQSAAAGARQAGDFSMVFDLCAMQRLMQALGAYGFLGIVKGRPHFLRHIPAALASLREVVARIPGVDAFARLLETMETTTPNF
jgi:aminoglycoside/choline kinase family phosphotransferase